MTTFAEFEVLASGRVYVDGRFVGLLLASSGHWLFDQDGAIRRYASRDEAIADLLRLTWDMEPIGYRTPAGLRNPALCPDLRSWMDIRPDGTVRLPRRYVKDPVTGKRKAFGAGRPVRPETAWSYWGVTWEPWTESVPPEEEAFAMAFGGISLAS